MFEADILKRQNFYDLPSDTKQLDFIKDNTFKKEEYVLFIGWANN